MTTTTDLTDFGFRELRMAAKLMTAYCEQPPEFLTDRVHITRSVCLFLTDEEFNVVMINGGKLVQWHSCAECGVEGFAEDMPNDECCQRYRRQAG